MEANLKRQFYLLSSVVIGLMLFTASCATSQPTQAVVVNTTAASTQSSPTVVVTTPGVVNLPAVSNQSSSAQATQPPAGASTQSASSSGDVLTCVLVQGKSTAQYKVREQLAKFNFPTDAIGKTQDVSGTIAFKQDGSVDQSVSKFVVGLASLQTDQSMRDNYVRRSILQTDQYPQAVFVPTQADGFPNPLPQSGTVAFKLTGNLTIRDVTKPVTLDVNGTVQNNSFTGTATTSFKFEDFNLSQPQVPVVLSVVDNINLELDITMQRSQN